ncbi:Ig-like domain-containing protein, partial [Flavobacterium polysaccharolyticum]
ASAIFNNAAQLVTPAVPTISSTAASCSSAETSTISNYNASNTYTFDPATPGITINTTTGLISGLIVGTDYTVTSGNGSCTSVASAIFNNAAQLAVPSAALVLGGTSSICTGATTNISVTNSEVGISYQLRDGVSNIGSAVIGTGGTISLSTGALNTTTTFNVLAINTSTTCTVQLTETEIVTVSNCSPVASNSVINVAEESTNTTLGLAAPTDPDSGVLTITVTGLPTLGTVTLANGTTIINGQTLTSAQLIGLQYDAPVDYNGTDSVGNFTYSVSDGNTTVSGQTTITVTPDNDAPVAQDNAYSGSEDAGNITGNVITDNDATAGLDGDVDSTTLTVQDYTIAGITGVQAVGSAVTIPSVGAITILADGSLTFVPLANYNGTVPTISYTLTDGASTDTANVVITVTPDNDAPVAQDNAYSGSEDAGNITGNVITDNDATAGLDG